MRSGSRDKSCRGDEFQGAVKVEKTTFLLPVVPEGKEQVLSASGLPVSVLTLHTLCAFILTVMSRQQRGLEWAEQSGCFTGSLPVLGKQCRSLRPKENICNTDIPFKVLIFYLFFFFFALISKSIALDNDVA